jgi:hypothetical protein
MSDGMKDKATQGLKKTWCNTSTFAVNTGRRAKILSRYTLAWWQQGKIDKAMKELGAKAYQALERGEADPLQAPEVGETLQKVKELKERKDKNYLAIEAIRERIRTSCVIATPNQPGGMEETPESP